mgnify:CR=1 FL=1
MYLGILHTPYCSSRASWQLSRFLGYHWMGTRCPAPFLFSIRTHIVFYTAIRTCISPAVRIVLYAILSKCLSIHHLRRLLISVTERPRHSNMMNVGPCHPGHICQPPPRNPLAQRWLAGCQHEQLVRQWGKLGVPLCSMEREKTT